jgi:hypothetical protein
VSSSEKAGQFRGNSVASSAKPEEFAVFLRHLDFDIGHFAFARLFSATCSATIMGFPAGLKDGRVGSLARGIPPFSFGRSLVRKTGRAKLLLSLWLAVFWLGRSLALPNTSGGPDCRRKFFPFPHG